MKKRINSSLKFILPILFWLIVWEVAALIIDFPYFLPDIPQTLVALIKIITASSTYKILFKTFFRVVISIIISSVFAVILAVLSNMFDIVRVMLMPLIAVMKSVPVAIFSILFYIFIRGDVIPVLIAFFMIMPLIWQNLIDGYNSIDKNLYEVCTAYQFSFKKRMKVLVLPALLKFFIPAVITSVGFAWKAVISSEILVRTVDSVGRMISDSKYQMDTATSYAWTFIAIILSICLEKAVKHLLGRCKL